jgi:hypothetical protein
MPQFVSTLPAELENGEAIIKRREKAAARKSLWRSLLEDCYRYAMPARELFSWQSPGAFKNHVLYDSTLQDSTYAAANTTAALLFPSWMRWGKVAPGGDFPKELLTPELMGQLQEITDIFFDYLNHSNFSTVSNEVALDLMVGTGALRFDEGPMNDNPFVFSSTPLAALELEEGPNGTIETVFMLRKPVARNLTRMYENMELFDLPLALQEKITAQPDAEIEIIQGTVYHPESKHYYGVVVWSESKSIIWRYDYGTSSPDIVARASRIAGEIYGRGRVMLALADARTLDKMTEFVLRHSALQIAPPMTGVSDGVLNPYTAVLQPNVIMPVASNDSRNPSLSVVEFGGNFAIGDTIMDRIRDRIRRTMLGPEPSEGPIKSATEVTIDDRNRLWALGGEFGRIQVEFLVKVFVRGLNILQNRGLIPPTIKVDGRVLTLKFTSPFARSQDAEDLMALERTAGMLDAYFPGAKEIGLDIDQVTEWISRKTGLDQSLVNAKPVRDKLRKDAAEAAASLAQQAAEQGQLPTA